MTTGLSTTVANAILDAYARSVAWTEPVAVYVQLHTGDPGSAGSSNIATNTTRQQATFSAASGGSITTSADTIWTNVPATETYAYVSFHDASTAGNFLGSDALNTPESVTATQTFTLAAGVITLTLAPIAA